MIQLPANLLQRIEYDYVEKNYRAGSFIVQPLSSDTLELVLSSLFAWAEENGFITEDTMDLSFVKQKD